MDGIRTAGVPVTFTTAGDLDAVPAGVSLAAYRIVQEALTNVVRHAGRAEATVAVLAADDHVSLCVEDDGRGSTVALDPDGLRGGHGLIGMSERARMYGGELGTGPRPGGGFRVQATLRYFPSPRNGDRPADQVSDSPGTGRAATSLRRPDVCVWDVLLATLMAVLVAAEIIGSPLTAAGQLFSSPDLREWLLKLGCCLALVGRRRWPTVSLAAICLLTLVLNYGGYQLGVIFFALLIGVYAVANNSSGRRLVAALMVVFVEMAMLASSTPPQAPAGAAVWVGIFVGATAIAGYVARRDREQSSTELAEREDAVDARSRRALLVITTERLRIADELSAIIRRSLHAITHEAGEGSQLVFADPVAARRALEAISATSRDALNDLRLLLRRIRTEDEPALYAPVTATLPAVPAGEAR
jgi:signal transduction histidine kinase